MFTHSRQQTGIRLLVFLLAFGLVFPAWPALASQPELVQNESVIIAKDSPIQIAVAMYYDWPTVQDSYDAVQMAIDDFGAIKGFDIQRKDYDAGCNQGMGSSAATDIVANPQTVGVIGPLCSSSTKGAAPIFETALLVMISPSNTMPDLHTGGPNIFNRVVLKDPGADAWIATLKELDSVKQWEAAFQAKFDRAPDDFAKLFYDATTLLLTRIQQVSTLDGSGNLVIDRARLAAAVRNTFNFEGITGPITLDYKGDRVDPRMVSVWADHFDGPELGAGWTWLEEDPDHWSLSEGFLHITTQQEAKNLLLRNIPVGDFEIRTRLIFSPVENFQFAGVNVSKDPQNFLAFGRAFCGTSNPACVGNGIYFIRVEGGKIVGNHAMVVSIDDEAYLRLVFSEGKYTGFVSINGTEWTLIGSHTVSFTPNQIGLSANNQLGPINTQPLPEITADFDYFAEMSTNWKKVYIPVVIR